jgi:transposase InsO family protein
LYKWLKRQQAHGTDWAEEHSRRPQRSPAQIGAAVEASILAMRRSLAQRQLFHGAQAIAWELAETGLAAPSVRTISRVLERHGLSTRARGPYVAKGTAYPALRAERPGQVHQSDFVGPCFLRGPVRFYSLHSIDVATGRCGVQRVPNRSSQPTLDAFWALWSRLGIPEHQQIDNEMVFFGSRAHPRGLGPLIRLCLTMGVEPWFIPPAEPWRNGVVEKFNDRWQQFGPLRRVVRGATAVDRANEAFEARHNAHYRYSKLGGRTPNAVLASSGVALRFPEQPTAPRHPLPKPTHGRYHLTRFVRHDGAIDLFGERLRVPPEALYAYVCATIDVGRQRLTIRLDDRVIDQHRFLIR